MAIGIDLILVAAVTIYIVDVSGFTDSWRSLIASKLHIQRMRPLPPFDCGTCMTWWVCLIYCICTGHLCLETIAISALLSLLAVPIGSAMVCLREWMTWIFNKLLPR